MSNNKDEKNADVLWQVANRTAHDINNILGAIQMYCDLIKRKASDARTVQDCVSKIEQAASHGESHTKNLLDFLRAGSRE